MISIITASVNDLDALFEIEKNCFDENDRFSIQNFQDELSNNNRLYLIAKCNDNVVAYVGASTIFDNCEIMKIAVLPTFRKMNIASKMLNELFLKLKPMNIEKVFLEVSSANNSAINLYEKIGFKKIGVRKNYYHNSDAYNYEYNLAVDCN